MWGPFSSTSAGCAAINSNTPPIQSSYSPSSTETVAIGAAGGDNSACATGGSPGASTPASPQVGQYYIIVATNYADVAGSLTLNQTSGSGGTDCSIVTPPSCSISSVTATAACNGGISTISGVVNVTGAPTTGTLTVSSSCGGSQVINSPFSTTSGALNYTFAGGPADGSTCTITATFSADAACTGTTTVVKAVTNPPAPTITKTPADCSNQEESTIGNYTATNTYTFSPAGPTVSSTGVISNAPAGTAYTITVSSNGCGTSTATFTNNPKLNATTPTFTNPGPICTGSTLTLPTVSNEGVGGTWSPAANNTATTTYTFTPAAGSAGCATSTTMTVQVNPANAVTLAPNPGPLCEGTAFTLPSTTPNGIVGVWTPAINDTITTTYTFTPNPGQCAADTTMTVVIKQAPNLTVTPLAQTICSGEKINIKIFSDSTGATIGWVTSASTVTGATNGTGNVIIDKLFNTGTTPATITYTIIASKNGCSSAPINVVITVNPAPASMSTVSLTASDKIVEEGNSTNLNVTVSPYIPGVLYGWTPPQDLNCSDCPNPIATPTQSTWYTVTVKTPEGCTMTDSIFIKYKIKCGDIFIPTIFSPNGDGANDIFKVYSRCLNRIQLSIYDRWGNKIFYTEDVSEGWDGTFQGKMMNTGTYVYKAIVTLIDDTKTDLKGSVTLTR
jgi:gliding motility-associated-like protein